MVQYRVWIHPKRGDVFYYTFTSLRAAVKFSKRHPNAEVPLRATGRNGFGGGKEYSISKTKLMKAAARKRKASSSFNNPFW